MSAQKGIMSFFSKGPAKPKVTESGDVKKVEKEPVKASKKKSGVIESDSEDEKMDDKENSSEKGNNTAKAKKEEGKDTENGEKEEVDEKKTETVGTPPLRITARRAFKRPLAEEDEENTKKSKKEKKTKENMSKSKVKEEEEDESPVKPKKSKKSRKSEESEKKEDLEDMEVEEVKEVKEEGSDSPVKPKSKKKKAVIESDSEDSSSETSSSAKETKKIEKAEEKSKAKKKAVIDSDSEDSSSETLKKEVKTEDVEPDTKDEESKEDSEKKSDKEKKSSKEDISPKKSPVKEEPKKSPVKEETKKDKKKTSPKEKPKAMSNFFTKKETSTPKQKESSDKPDKPSSSDKPSSTGSPAPTKNQFKSFFTPKAGAKSTRNEGGSDYDEIVKKTSYHPIDNSFWQKGEKTPYLALANTLKAIEETSGRLKTIEFLSNYFRSVMVQTPEDLLPSVYMTLNRLAPAWEGLELGIGETLLVKAIANTTGRSVAQIKTDAGKCGDLGLVAETSRGGQRTMFQPAILTVRKVFDTLKEVANMTGNSCGNKKVEKIQSLLVACRGSEARYLIRSLAGKLRIGMAEQSVLQALAQACVQTPLGQDYPPEIPIAYKSSDNEAFKEKLAEQSLKLKTAYCECPTYDMMIPALLEKGVDKLHEVCKLTPGIPLKPMLAHPTKGVQEVLTRFENCKFTCEWKYDGERAQVHLHEDGSMNIFSRNQENNTTKFPDVIARFKNCLGPNVKSAVIDSEAVAWDREKKTIQPFQVLSTRKRKDAVEADIKVQVVIFAFDLLYLNGETLVRKSFEERRQLLKDNFKPVEGEFDFAKAVDGETTEEIQEALEMSIKENCEGLMVKTLDVDATYEIARRSHNWLKLKKDYLDGVGDTLDLVVIGGYHGKGKRTGGYGGFLLACYEPENEEYQSICKIGTGFSDEDLAKHSEFFKDHVIEKPKSYYAFDTQHTPDHWFDVAQVWEVKCADLSISPVHCAAKGIVDPSKGISLRFPRFLRIRDDKKPEDATNAEQIATMYNSQDVVKNSTKQKASAEDDFDF